MFETENEQDYKSEESEHDADEDMRKEVESEEE